MPKFTTPYRSLTLQDDKGVWGQFTDGEFTTTDAAVIKRLRALPESEQISEAKDEPAGDAKE